MASRRFRRIVTIGLVLIAAGGSTYFLSRVEPAPHIVGVVRATEVRVAPEVAGQLTTIKVEKGAHVRAGDVVAELSAIELTAAVGQARAALVAATAERDHVYAGVRDEELETLAAEIAKTGWPKPLSAALLGSEPYGTGEPLTLTLRLSGSV